MSRTIGRSSAPSELVYNPRGQVARSKAEAAVEARFRSVLPDTARPGMRAFATSGYVY